MKRGLKGSQQASEWTTCISSRDFPDEEGTERLAWVPAGALSVLFQRLPR